MLVEQLTKAGGVANIDLRKGITRVSRPLRDRGEVRCICKLVDIDDICAGVIEQVPDYGRPDEAGAPGHKNGLAFESHAYTLGAARVENELYTEIRYSP